MGCGIKKPPENVKISTSGRYDKSIIRLFGDSNLPKGSVLNLEIKETEKGKQIYSEIIKVSNKGAFSWTDDNPDPTKDCSINLTFDPSKQSKVIQKIYGKNGENIKKDKYAGVISKNGKVTIQKTINLGKLDRYMSGGSW